MDRVGDDIGLRRATSDDSRKVWEWRNSEEVRSVSFSESVIPWEVHERWFSERLADKNTYIYIAHIKSNDKIFDIGVIRFEVKGDNSGEVSVFLAPEYIGRGYGSRIIREGTERFVSESGVRRVLALIREKNIASARSFEKAGYRYSGRTGDGDVLIYEWWI